jgi:hypothetical protein
MSNGARHPFRDLFGDAAAGPMLTDADLQHIERRAQRLAQRGEQPPGVAGIRARAAEQAELAQEINQALHMRDMPLAQALIREGAAVYGHGPLLAAVEAHSRHEAVEAVAAAEVARREADQADPWSDDREPYDSDEGWPEHEPR